MKIVIHTIESVVLKYSVSAVEERLQEEAIYEIHEILSIWL
jgi:hypothetical protein